LSCSVFFACRRATNGIAQLALYEAPSEKSRHSSLDGLSGPRAAFNGSLFGDVTEVKADFSFAPNTFAIFTMSPQVAVAYLPTLAYLGPR